LSKNRVKNLGLINLPCLKKLNLNENLIASCAELKMQSILTVLELRKNKLTDCTGLNINCSELYLADNKITSFAALYQGY
jgi:Leucine-rich repeat (LRR) protein